MSLTEEFSSLWSDLNPKLAALAVEAKELRELPGESSESEDVGDLHARLIRTRQAQDRLEAIVAEVGRVRARARQMVAETRSAYDDAWNLAAQNTRVGEYNSAKEKDAQYSTASFTQLLAKRRAEKMEAEVSEVFEYCMLKHKGLDASRRDVGDRVRMLSVQSVLEN